MFVCGDKNADSYNAGLKEVFTAGRCVVRRNYSNMCMHTVCLCDDGANSGQAANQVLMPLVPSLSVRVRTHCITGETNSGYATVYIAGIVHQ